MKCTEISRSYSQSVQLKLKDGRESWIKHDASINAILEEGDDCINCLEQLQEWCLKHVVKACAEQKKRIMADAGTVREDDPAAAVAQPSAANMPRL